jgi:uncharacterized protein (DUF1697 family)
MGVDALSRNMTRYVAFLRAINVGGHAVVKMDDLRGLFESMGLSQVETYIASGNVIFESAAGNAQTLEKGITDQLHEALGYEVATFIRTTAELSEIAQHQPFPDSDLRAAGVSLYIGFLAGVLSHEAQQTVMSFKTQVDDFQVHGREIYWLCRVRSSESEFSLARLEKALGVRATFRNSTTVKKMATKYATQS